MKSFAICCFLICGTVAAMESRKDLIKKCEKEKKIVNFADQFMQYIECVFRDDIHVMHSFEYYKQMCTNSEKIMKCTKLLEELSANCTYLVIPVRDEIELLSHHMNFICKDYGQTFAEFLEGSKECLENSSLVTSMCLKDKEPSSFKEECRLYEQCSHRGLKVFDECCSSPELVTYFHNIQSSIMQVTSCKLYFIGFMWNGSRSSHSFAVFTVVGLLIAFFSRFSLQ